MQVYVREIDQRLGWLERAEKQKHRNTERKAYCRLGQGVTVVLIVEMIQNTFLEVEPMRL